MIKAITYQGNTAFKANLYALEIKSRFIDQRHADGYYIGYGSELSAQVVGNQIRIGTGAFVVQGRMNEVVSAETVSPSIYNNFVGYVVARVETYHPEDTDYCTFKAYVNTALSEIPLQQDDIYAMDADNLNKVYELPIYSFEIKNGTITNLQKLIRPIDDYARVQAQINKMQDSIDNAIETITSSKSEIEIIATESKTTAENAERMATEANNKANDAEQMANNAEEFAIRAQDTAKTAKEIADNTVTVVNNQHQEMTAELNALAQQIGEKLGTTIIKDGVALNTIDADELTAKLQVRSDTADNWESQNPILTVGEIGYDITNKKTKIGDGETAWEDLAWFATETPPILPFAEATWEQINKISKSGQASDYYKVGDEKEIELSTGEKITLIILGFNHDNLSDGSGKAGITIGLKNLLYTGYSIHIAKSNVLGWGNDDTGSSCAMRRSTLPTLFQQLPNELQSVIKIVNKLTSAGNKSTNILTSADSLFLLSEIEVYGTISKSVKGEGEIYEYYRDIANTTEKRRKFRNGTSWALTWWLRSPEVNNNTSYCIVRGGTADTPEDGGSPSSYYATSTAMIAYAFCV